MRLIVTRAEPAASQWQRALTERGWQAHSLPLIVIASLPDAQPLRWRWQQLDRFQALMFVSANAVRHFFMQKPVLVGVPPVQSAINIRAWASGPGTTQALLQAGVAADLIDAPAADTSQFDSEALWQRVRGQVGVGDRVLIVRGALATTAAVSVAATGTGRDWLAQQLQAAGVAVEWQVAYLRAPPPPNPGALALAQAAASDASVWLFGSAEAVQNLRRWLPAQDWSHARALATHERIAQAARSAGFGWVGVTRPTLAEVVASIESLP